MTESPPAGRHKSGAAWPIVADGQNAPAVAPWQRGGMSWLTSLVLHGVILVVLGLWAVPLENPLSESRLDIAPALIDQEDVEDLSPEGLSDSEISIDMAGPAELQPVTDEVQVETDIESLNDLEAASLRVVVDELSDASALRDHLLTEIGSSNTNALRGRGGATRSELVRQGGGTEGSERAVALALAWLAEHQNTDGSWSFQHHLGPCQGRCPDEGQITKPARNGATALALLPFLGAGQTHTEGKYRKTVGRGINYLLRASKAGRNGSLWDAGGQLYSHAFAAIALSEAYAMTEDKRLRVPAQRAIDFVVYSQDPLGGGWRYLPHQPGDTSAIGWQIMALKSGQLAYLNVPELTLRRATLFLNSVEQEGGAFYGYMLPGVQHRSGTTAIGLLCRMYLGWRQDNEALRRGIEWFSEKGPARNDFYANYYAMQLMFHYTGAKGPTWSDWNTGLRDQLVDSQETEGHRRGSWYRSGGVNSSNSIGGRLYCTAMAVMTLEVYYRHMPLYRQVFTDDDVDDDFDE